MDWECRFESKGKNMARAPLRNFVSTPFIFAFVVAGATFATAAQPQVTRAVPDNGDKNVDPGLREIRVEFDQDMQQGSFSWCGGGESFPAVLGRPTWDGPRIGVLRVRLKPDHEYRLSVNCLSARNFIGVNGESARAYPIIFRTRASTDSTKVGSEKALHAEAVTMLRAAIVTNYSYRDRTGIDWGQLIDSNAERLGAAGSPEKFAQEAASILGAARDVHLWLEVKGRAIATFQRNVQPNGNLSQLRTLVPNFKQHNPVVSTGRFENGVGYILISTWSAKQRALLEPAYVALADFADAPGLIVDVRFNSGGAEPLAAEFAGCFIDTAKVYAKHVTVSAIKAGGFTAPKERVIERNRARPKWRGKIAVLTGPYVMSSCEAFLLMMKQVSGCKLIGETSFGASGNPKPFVLSNNVTVYVPSWKAMLPDGTVFEGVGIAPDVHVDTSPDDLRERDPVLDIALRSLRWTE